MNKGTVVKIITQCVPPGLVPPKFGMLLYPYSSDGKWYAVETDRRDFAEIVDSKNIDLLKAQVLPTF